jgi:hypothetical protein
MNLSPDVEPDVGVCIRIRGKKFESEVNFDKSTKLITLI